MLRSDRECHDQEFLENVLQSAETIFLALEDGDYPYCLPVNFAYADNRLYIHCALHGRKLDCIAKNPHIAFSTAIDIQIDVARATTYYKSICGRGMAAIVEDEKEKGRALDLLATRYDAKCKQPAPLANIRRVAIIRVDIVEWSGKRSLPQAE